jgi:hypothetical protein
MSESRIHDEILSLTTDSLPLLLRLSSSFTSVHTYTLILTSVYFPHAATKNCDAYIMRGRIYRPYRFTAMASRLTRISTTSSSYTRTPWSPRTSPTAMSYTAPFTRSSLKAIQEALERHHTRTPWSAVDGKETHAAVLAPLCNVNGKPGVLLQVRGKSLRSHSGEAR